MDRCPFCQEELLTKIIDVTRNPDNEFMVGKKYSCKNHGVFILNLPAQSAVESDPRFKSRAEIYLTPDDGKIRIIYNEVDSKGVNTLVCTAHQF